MRYLLIILIFSNVCLSQYIHTAEDYRLSTDKYVNEIVLSPNKLFLNSIIVNPIKSNVPVSNFITDILLKGDTVWFATGSGLMRTVDHFNSFEYYYGLAPFGEDDIAGFNLKDNILVASTAISQETASGSVAVGTGIKISTDNGLNWLAYPQPLDTQADSIFVYGSNNIRALPVVVPQQNLSYDIAITRTHND